MTVIGIDLGTTNSVVAIYEKGMARTVPINGYPSTPSVINWDASGRLVVGHAAKKRAILYPEATVVSNKRMMGNRDTIYGLPGGEMNPVQVCTALLTFLRKGAETQLARPVKGAVITVPAYFNQNQKEDTLLAAQEAGLEVLKLQAEPTAAAIAYGVGQGRNQTVLVYDLGGGTFDVSILEIHNNSFTVKAIGGDATLGGDNFDEAILEKLYKEIQDQLGLDLKADRSQKARAARQQLKEIAEQAKIELSTLARTDQTLADLMGKGVFNTRLKRSEYAELVRPFLTRTTRILRDTLRDAELEADDIARVICVGGSTKSPLVYEILTDEVRQPYLADNVDEIVAHGAAITAASLAAPVRVRGQQSLPIEITDTNVTPFALGIRLEQDRFGELIPKNTALPVLVTREYTTTRNDATSTEIVVFQGEHELCVNNVQLGGFALEGIHKARAGEPRIQVRLELDKNDILQIQATDSNTRAGGNLEIRKFQAKTYEPSPERTADQVRIGVSRKGCDDMGSILEKMGYAWKLINDSAYQDKRVLDNYDILFINCCAGGPPGPQMAEFVARGGVLYVSDLSARLLRNAFPDKIEFGWGGQAHQTVSALVVNQEAREALGKDSVRIHFDMTAWVPINKTAPDVEIYLEAKVHCIDKGIAVRPLMAGFKHGSGYVIYTAFHNHALPPKRRGLCST